jgi:predicted ATPase
MTSEQGYCGSSSSSSSSFSSSPSSASSVSREEIQKLATVPTALKTPDITNVPTSISIWKSDQTSNDTFSNADATANTSTTTSSSSHTVTSSSEHVNQQHLTLHHLRHDRRTYFHDRSSETAQLCEAFYRHCATAAAVPAFASAETDSNSSIGTNCSTHEEWPSEIVLINGFSGAGKTTLAESLQPIVQKHSGFFLRGKYDFLERPEPYYPIIQALTDMVDSILSSTSSHYIHPEIMSQVETSVKKVLEAEPLLVDLIPALRRWIPVPAHRSVRGAEARKRLTCAWGRLWEALASPNHPVVLVLDDLQWAEPASIDLVRALYHMDPPIAGFLVVGTVRGNEVSFDQPLSMALRALEQHPGIVITEINLVSMTPNEVDVFFEPFVCAMSIENTEHRKTLSRHIYEQTQGNFFFLWTVIDTLIEHGYIQSTPDETTFSSSTIATTSHNSHRKWEGIKRITTRWQTIGDFISDQIQQLPSSVQQVLMTASCFGYTFQPDLLQRVLPTDHDILQSLQI